MKRGNEKWSQVVTANQQTWPTPESHLDTHAVEPKNSILMSSAVKEGVFSTIKSFSASSAKCRNVRPTIPHHKSPSAVGPVIIIQRISQIHQLFSWSFLATNFLFFLFVYFPVSSLLSLTLSVSVCRCITGNRHEICLPWEKVSASDVQKHL